MDPRAGVPLSCASEHHPRGLVPAVWQEIGGGDGTLAGAGWPRRHGSPPPPPVSSPPTPPRRHGRPSRRAGPAPIEAVPSSCRLRRPPRRLRAALAAAAPARAPAAAVCVSPRLLFGRRLRRAARRTAATAAARRRPRRPRAARAAGRGRQRGHHARRRVGPARAHGDRVRLGHGRVYGRAAASYDGALHAAAAAGAELEFGETRRLRVVGVVACRGTTEHTLHPLLLSPDDPLFRVRSRSVGPLPEPRPWQRDGRRLLRVQAPIGPRGTFPARHPPAAPSVPAAARKHIDVHVIPRTPSSSESVGSPGLSRGSPRMGSNSRHSGTSAFVIVMTSETGRPVKRNGKRNRWSPPSSHLTR